MLTFEDTASNSFRNPGKIKCRRGTLTLDISIAEDAKEKEAET